MTESYDPGNYILLIALGVFYWQLLRIWHQPPPQQGSDKTAGENKPAGPVQPSDTKLRQLPAPLVAVREDRLAVQPGGPAADSRTADQPFDEKAFLAGAALAYELVLQAYAEEDMQVLDHLLEAEAGRAFRNAVAARASRGERLSMTFIGVKHMEIVEAWSEADLAEVTVRFTGEAVAATYGRDGSLVDGHPERIIEMTDTWTFARRVTSSDPNWKLVATE